MRVFACAAVLLTATRLLVAQEGTGWVVVQGGVLKSGSSEPVKTGAAAGLGVGGWFTDHWGLEASVLDARVESRTSSIKGQELQGTLSLLANFAPGSALTPFLRLGLGAVYFGGGIQDLEAKRRMLAQAGLGLQVRPGSRFLATAEYRVIRIGRRDPRRNESAWLGGIGYRWGSGSVAGRSAPAGVGPALVEAPMVEALPASPQAPPPAETLPPASGTPGVEVVPPAKNPPPPAVLLP